MSETYGISERDVARLKRLLDAFESGRLDRLIRPEALHLGGPLWTRIGQVGSGGISGLAGAVPGSGSVQIEQIDLSSTPAVVDASPAGNWEPAYNAGAFVAAGAHVALLRDPFSGQNFLIPLSLLGQTYCFLDKVCPQFTTIYASLSGSGPLLPLNVVTGLTNEMLCLDTASNTTSLSCFDNPDDCCLTPAQCCCVCDNSADLAYITFSNPSTPDLSCMDGYCKALPPQDLTCQTVARILYGINTDNGKFCPGCDGQGPLNLCPMCAPEDITGGTCSLICGENNNGSWQQIGLSFEWHCDDFRTLEGTSWTNVPPGSVGYGGILPDGGSCGAAGDDSGWFLQYTAVPVYRNGVLIGTVDARVTCDGCSSGSASSSGSGSCNVSSLGLGKEASPTTASSLTFSGVTVQGGTLLIVNAATTNTASALAVTYNGVAMLLDNAASNGGGGFLYTFSLPVNSTTTADIVATLAVGNGCISLDAVQVTGLVNNAKDKTAATNGTGTHPSVGPTAQTSAACEYANAAFLLRGSGIFLSGWSRPFKSGNQDVDGTCTTFPSPPAFTLTEGYDILSSQGTPTAALNSTTTVTWAGVLTTYS